MVGSRCYLDLFVLTSMWDWVRVWVGVSLVSFNVS